MNFNHESDIQQLSLFIGSGKIGIYTYLPADSDKGEGLCTALESDRAV